MKNQKTMILATLLLGSTSLAPAAFAQDTAAEGDAVTSVYERSRPDYDAPGIRSGSFLFYPAVGVEGKYNSNIYAEESNVTDDFIVAVKPSFNLVSDWNSSYLEVFAKADIGRYLDNGGENYEDYGFGLNGRKDISYGTDFHGNVAYDQKHEDRGSPDAVGNASEPTQFSVMAASLGFKRDVSILSFAVDAEYVKRNFDSVALNGGGVRNNDHRDRDRRKGTLRIGYEMADGYEAFVRGSMDRIEYDDSKQNGGPQRNSDGYEAVVGAAFDLTGKAKGEFYVGYMKRAYDSDSLDNTDGINFGAELLWNATGLTSFQGTVKRSIEETTVGGNNSNGVFVNSSGIVATLFSGRVEHELRRNVLLNADVSYTRQNFELTTREDELWGAKLGLKYLLNPNFDINAGYSYDYRDTTTQGQDYQRHSFRVGIKGQW
ncbi:outer membrane beta-barrel protein [Kordiimonas sp.]|uniref:outer membrane beta-barrel protein n=1 Tax=Kordiimonas sp. TaxID=1970157 RepID=UPI003A8F30D1